MPCMQEKLIITGKNNQIKLLIETFGTNKNLY